jgi:hypothetical protein
MRLFPSVASLSVLAATGLLSTLATSAVAEEWPSLRPGLWEFTRTMVSSRAPGKPRVVKATRCVDPVADMKQQNARLTRAGCAFSPMVRHGNTYTFSSECKLAGMVVRSKSLLTVVSPTAYRLHVETSEDGAPGKEDMVARRVGECGK